jgi:hypothetical protein
MRINHTDLPIKASMGMLTQPISFLGLPVATVPVKTASDCRLAYRLLPPLAGVTLPAGGVAAGAGGHSLPTGSMMNREHIDRPTSVE